jgi:hypothetical protein
MQGLHSGSGSPEGSLTGRRLWDWVALAALSLTYVALIAAYFPPIPAIEDEVEFINQASVWSSGHLSAEAAGYDRLLGFVPVGGRSVAWRNPGRPLITIPFIGAGGVPAAIMSGAAVHLGAVFVLALVFMRLGCSPLWAALALFHPTMILYSRTVMADGTAALFVLLAIRAGLGTRWVGAGVGIFLALAMVCRYHFAVVILPAAVAVWAVRRPAGDGLLQATATLLVAAAVGGTLAVYNWIALGDPRGFIHQGYFSWAMVPENLPRYAASLMLVWPGLLVALFFVRGPAAWYVHAIAWPQLALLLPYYWMDRGGSIVSDLVLGLRLYLPGVAALLVAYGVVLDRVVRSSGLVRWFSVLALAGLLVPTAFLMRQHQNHLLALASARDEIQKHIPPGAYVFGNSTAAKLFAIPEGGKLHYRWILPDPSDGSLRPDEQPPTDREWYVVSLTKQGQLTDFVESLRREYLLESIPTQNPGLVLYQVSGRVLPKTD